MLVRVFIYPSVSEGSPVSHPEASLFCHPEPPPFVTPRRKARGLPLKRHPEQSEGSLGTGVPLEDIDGVPRKDMNGQSPRA